MPVVEVVDDDVVARPPPRSHVAPGERARRGSTSPTVGDVAVPADATALSRRSAIAALGELADGDPGRRRRRHRVLVHGRRAAARRLDAGAAAQTARAARARIRTLRWSCEGVGRRSVDRGGRGHDSGEPLARGAGAPASSRRGVLGLAAVGGPSAVDEHRLDPDPSMTRSGAGAADLAPHDRVTGEASGRRRAARRPRRSGSRRRAYSVAVRHDPHDVAQDTRDLEVLRGVDGGDAGLACSPATSASGMMPPTTTGMSASPSAAITSGISSRCEPLRIERPITWTPSSTAERAIWAGVRRMPS